MYVDKKTDATSAILLETCVNDAKQEETIEPTFVLAGILVQCNLPPIRSRNQ